MHSQSAVSIFLFILLQLQAICASPINKPREDMLEALRKRGSASVSQVANPNYVSKSGMAALARAYAKYTGSVPAWLSEAMANKATRRHRGNKGGGGQNNGGAAVTDPTTTTTTADTTVPTADNAAANPSSGSAPTTPETDDREFLTPVSIAGQTLNLDFDSGSSDLWVFSDKQSAQQIGQHTAFQSAQSNSFQLSQGSTFDVSYGDGSEAAGLVGTDTVAVGGVTITQQAVEVATAVSQSFIQDVQSDGLMGLAFSTLNTVKPRAVTTFLDSAIAQGVLAQPVFTADLKAGAVGTYEFGAIDTTKFSGQLSDVAIDNSKGFWQFTSSGFAVGSDPQLTATNFQAIADTGTTLLLLDDSVVSAYYSQVQGATLNQAEGGVTFPCNTALPDLVLEMGGTTQTLVSGTLLNLAQVGGGQCFGGLQSNGGIGLSIYGDVWFKSSFVVFDAATPKLQVAPKA